MKRLCLLLMLPVVLGLVGCSSQDFGRPIARIGDVVDSGKAYVEDSSEEEAIRRAAQLADILAEWERQKQTVDEDYTLGPDDVLTIGILSLEAPGVVAELIRTISKDGTVALPLVGAVACAGMTARECQERVVAAYRGKYLQEPQVDVAVKEFRSAPVVVTGAVGQPGVYYLRHNQSSVLEVLSMANGLTEEAGSTLMIVRRRRPEPSVQAVTPPVVEPVSPPQPVAMPPGQAPWTGSHIADLVAAMAEEEATEAQPGPWTGSHIADLVASMAVQEQAAEQEAAAVLDQPEAVADTADVAAELDAPEEGEADEDALDADLVTVDLEQLLDRGDVRLNLPIEGGDIVTVPPGRREYVYVLGYVQRPGAFELKGRKRVRALQAVAMAGGLSGAARAQNSFLIIDKPTGRKVVSIDLTKIARGQRPPVYMESGHTLVIGSGMLARLAEFIKPSVTAGADLSPGP